ncbi:MAG: carboxypeptidase regulatory-like domain-containing protein [Clostridiales bacterium]|jgi:hypothetical protein|nr:carboxypeptidase regulatory-like domain-containing protein [Clostridiales bacterium]
MKPILRRITAFLIMIAVTAGGLLQFPLTVKAENGIESVNTEELPATETQEQTEEVSETPLPVATPEQSEEIATLQEDSTSGISYGTLSDSGTMEGGTSWAWYEDTATLVISGNGPIPDFAGRSSAPYYGYCSGNARHIIIEEGVTQIGDHGLDSASNILTLQIPSTVKRIGYEAFNLLNGPVCKDLVLPEGLEIVENLAFVTAELTKITFPSTLKEARGATGGHAGIFLLSTVKEIVFKQPADGHTITVGANFCKQVYDVTIVAPAAVSFTGSPFARYGNEGVGSGTLVCIKDSPAYQQGQGYVGLTLLDVDNLDGSMEKDLQFKVTNDNGEPVANANIEIYWRDTLVHTLQADSNGLVTMHSSSPFVFTTAIAKTAENKVSEPVQFYPYTTDSLIELRILGLVEPITHRKISGHVTRGEINQGGVVITAVSPSGKQYYAMSDTRGEYIIYVPIAESGNFRIYASQYDSISTEGDVVQDYPQGVEIADTDITNIDFNFGNYSSLEGIVTDTNGVPIENAAVYLLVNGRGYVPSTTDRTDGFTGTDGAFQFSVTDAQEGTVYVSAEGFEPKEKKVRWNYANITENFKLIKNKETDVNITFQTGLQPPGIRKGESATLYVSYANNSDKAVKDLVVEVEIPDGLTVDENSLPALGLQYNAATNTVFKSGISLDKKGEINDLDKGIFAFNVFVEENADANLFMMKVIARDANATVPSSVTDYVELLDGEWMRSKESKNTVITVPYNWTWSMINPDVRLPLDPNQEVWDSDKYNYTQTGYYPYLDRKSTVADNYATWPRYTVNKNYGAGYKADREMRRFQTSFYLPNEDYQFEYIVRENWEEYLDVSGDLRGALCLDDELFVFVHPSSVAMTDSNAASYLAMWGSTFYDEPSRWIYWGQSYPYFEKSGDIYSFMGVVGNRAVSRSGIAQFGHTDGWVLDGTQNRISEIIEANRQYSGEEWIIDIFTTDFNNAGAIDKFQLVFSNDEISPIDPDGSVTPSAAYYEIVGYVPLFVKNMSLTAEPPVVTATTAENQNIITFRVNTTPNTAINLLRYDTNEPVSVIDAENAMSNSLGYAEFTAYAPNTQGGYPYIAQTDNDISNVAVVRVDGVFEQTEANIELIGMKFFNTAHSHWRPQTIYDTLSIPASDFTTGYPLWLHWINAEAGDVVVYTVDDGRAPVSVTLGEEMTGYYRTSVAEIPLLTSGTKRISAEVLRGGDVIWEKREVATMVEWEKTIVDPSGIVTDKITGKPVSDATLTLYVFDGVNYVKWVDESGTQENPTVTDERGWYGWNVPDGMYMIQAVKNGYHDYCTLEDPDRNISLIQIPPPRTDVDFQMTNSQAPQIQSIEAYANYILVKFNKGINPDSLNISVSGADVEDVLVFSTKDAAAIIPAQPLSHGTYTLNVANVSDYSGNSTNMSQTFEAGASAGEELVVDSRTTTPNSFGWFKLNFNHAPGKSGLSGVVMKNTETGEIIPTNMYLNGKTLQVEPKAALQARTNYSLTLPKGLAGTIEESGESVVMLREITLTIPAVNRQTTVSVSEVKKDGDFIEFDVDSFINTTISTVNVMVVYYKDGRMLNVRRLTLNIGENETVKQKVEQYGGQYDKLSIIMLNAEDFKPVADEKQTGGNTNA